MNIRIYDHSYHEVVSGGDVIVAEFAKAWIRSAHTVRISTHGEALDFFAARNISNVNLIIASRVRTRYASVLLGSIAHLINAAIDTIIRKLGKTELIFAGSWSLQDLVPAVIDKMKNPKATLAVGCYIFLLPPWTKTYGSTWLNRYVFWVEYGIGMILTRIFANVIWTASPVDRNIAYHRFGKKAVAVRGGIDPVKTQVHREEKKKYDAVYLGRFHPQKNIIELIDIWARVIREIPDATLAIAGAGFLKPAMEERIAKLKLTGTVILLPPIDNEEKYMLFSQSKLFVSASHYDTGNLAMDEAMACGTPGVTYNLPKLVYPQGVSLITPFDTELFAKTIITLLADDKQRKQLGADAQIFARSIPWDTQANLALESIEAYHATFSHRDKLDTSHKEVKK